MEYRVAQLEALGRFLEEKKQEILEATALDVGKVRGGGAGCWAHLWDHSYPFISVLRVWSSVGILTGVLPPPCCASGLL